MNKPLDELYFIWLCRQVGSVDDTHPSRTYWGLLKNLFTKEFIWIVERDENRAEDGRDLRLEFIHEQRIPDIDLGWLDFDCSMLELLIGLSRRLSFEADGEPRDWFWVLIENLDLEGYNDDTHISQSRINKILDEVIWRTYRSNGRGGLFPLRKAHEDQRNIELWYQLNTYLLEAA